MRYRLGDFTRSLVLDRIATHIIAFTGDSDVTFFEGNYTEYEADRKKRLGDANPRECSTSLFTADCPSR